MIWLMGQLATDFKTIADFRKDKAIREVCCEVVALCRKLSLLTAANVRHRRIEVQGRQCAGQELHRGQDEAAAGADRREHRAISRSSRPPIRHGDAVPKAKTTRFESKIEKLRRRSFGSTRSTRR